MMKKVLLSVTTVILAAVCVFAQDENNNRRWGGGRRGGMNGGRGGMMMRGNQQRGGMRMQFRDMRGEAEKQIAAKFGKEYEALAKERAANEAKMQELAKKAGVTLPQADFIRRERMAAFEKKYEKELKEIAELQKTDFRAAMQKRMELMKKEGIEMPFMRGNRRPGEMRDGANGGNPGSRRGNPRAEMEKMMKEKLSADYADYTKLKKEDPAKAREKFREMARKLREMNRKAAAK